MNRRDLLRFCALVPFAGFFGKLLGGCGEEDDGFVPMLSFTASQEESVLYATERSLGKGTVDFRNYRKEGVSIDDPNGVFVGMLLLPGAGWVGGKWIFTKNGKKQLGKEVHAGKIIVKPGDEIVWLNRY